MIKKLFAQKLHLLLIIFALQKCDLTMDPSMYHIYSDDLRIDLSKSISVDELHLALIAECRHCVHISVL